MANKTVVRLIAEGMSREVLDWRDAIVTAGGSISVPTLHSADRFVKSMKGEGIWDKLYMVDLCAGDSLTAALVRLKVPAGISRTYTNVNFVAADYIERGASGGLTGNGSSKYLNSGIKPSSLGYSVTSFGMMAYTRTAAAGGTSQVSIGSQASASSNVSVLGWLNAGTQETGIIAGVAVDYPAGSASSLTGLWTVMNNGSQQTQVTRNGAAVGLPSAVESQAFLNANLFFHALNNNGTPISYASRRLSSKLLTQGLTFTEQLMVYNHLQLFESALGRSV